MIGEVSIQRDVSVSRLAKITGRSPAFIRSRFGVDGVKDENGLIWFSQAVADEIVLSLADIGEELRQYSVSRATFARELHVHEKTISKNFGRAGRVIDGVLRFERAFVNEVLREQGDVTAYTVSTQSAAEILRCSVEKARFLLKGKGRKKGRQLYYQANDVDAAVKLQEDTRFVGLAYLERNFRLNGPQLLHLLFATIDGPSNGPLYGLFRAHFSKEVLLPPPERSRYGFEWRAGVVVPWLERLTQNLETFLTDRSHGKFLLLGLQCHQNNHAWEDFNFRVSLWDYELSRKNPSGAADALRQYLD